MERTIKGKEIIAYKGMKSNMTCRDFQYEIGKTYKTDKAKLCECGFHAHLNPREIFSMSIYCYHKVRFFKVKLSGIISKTTSYSTQVIASEVTILEDITDNFLDIIKNIEWWKNDGVLDLLYYVEDFTNIQRGDGLYNLINKNGELLSNQWFKYCSMFVNNYAIVETTNKLYNFIDKNGNYLFDEWFLNLEFFDYNGFAIVQRKKDSLYNFIDKNGNYLSNEWFQYVRDFCYGFAIVKRNDNSYNFIDKNGKLLSDEWFIDVDDFNEYYGDVQRTNGEWAKIDKNGKLLDS